MFFVHQVNNFDNFARVGKQAITRTCIYWALQKPGEPSHPEYNMKSEWEGTCKLFQSYGDSMEPQYNMS